MKKALLKDSFKEIKKTYKRFISILLMAFLGVGFFAGVRATSPDMDLTIDSYLDKKNVYDIKLVSTLGLTDDDINEINKLENIEKVVGTFSEDVFIDFEDEEVVVKIYALENDINQVDLIEGKFPQNADECVIEESMKNSKNISIGDYIEIEENLKDEDEEPSFKNTKLKVVGTVKSPLYISRDRGTTTLGSGKISYYMYVNKENINSDIYTEIDILAKNTKNLISLREEYNNKIEKVEDELNTIKEERQNARYHELINEANQKLDDAQKEFDEQKLDAEKKIKDAENKIIEGKKEVADGEKEIQDGEKKLQEGKDEATNQFATADGQMAEAETTIIKSQEELNDAVSSLEEKKKEAESGIAQLQFGIDEINKQITDLSSQKNNIETALMQLIQIDSNISTLKEQLSKLEEAKNTLLQNDPNNKTELDGIILKITETQNTINNLESTKNTLVSQGISQENLDKLNAGLNECQTQKQTLENKLNSVNLELTNAQNQINDAQNKLNKAWQELNNSKVTLANTKADTESKLKNSEDELENGRKELEKAKKELQDGEKELQDKKEEFNKEIADAEAKLIDAREKVNDIETAKWYIFNREDDSGFNSFKQDTDNVKKLGEAFPIVFFIIAVLISLTSMSRMVEEERVQIGTLKALGYNRIQIMSKYIIYSLLASVLGGILGSIFGLKFFPTVIITIYQMMYDVSELKIVFNIYYASLGIGIMTICIVGSTIYTAIKELNSTPAEMMRPKAPKAGKRVLLEKIPFIWNRLNFTQKVTLRNMFRYKKRFLMTVIGICGCTALILTGFGLKDPISKIMDFQYVDIYDYDLLIGLKDTLTNEEKNSLISDLENKEEISKCVQIYMTSGSIKNNNIEKDMQIVVTSNPEELENVIRLKDLKTGEKLNLNDNEIIITDKLSELIKANVGDEIVLIDSDNNEYKAKIGGITEHYISHYIYMTENLYEKIFEKDINSNVLLTQYANEMSEEQEDILSKEILENSKVASVTLTSYLMKTINDTLKAMNFVVYVLIVSAGLLAFIVLYNLANINISERIRELATIKVLGFYDKEVYDYITREIVLLTIIGILLGLVFGFFLSSFILKTCEIEILRFKRLIRLPSYIYACVITIIFTLIVNLITYFSLKKVDMIESLKSVE